MSVAFRRESDEEHKEPRFELPIPAGANLVTPRGLALIEARVAMLEAGLTEATGEEARAALARDLRYWRTRRITAEVAPAPAGDEVAFGTRVTFRLSNTVRTIAIVGHDEADPAAGSIAFTAPLAWAMLGMLSGEKVAFNGREDAIEVLAILPGDDRAGG
ncbi:GreA/GreB family elongation factor [Sphingomonas bacterium]|uniref:GreA/GreB family elongation factor n=1 Tax=Sphingomonas bacterium TaxID=1895847 RepID=UPI001574FEBF|nr:GreA/GreB family elongation factor [Sphingomonas bacterium]